MISKLIVTVSLTTLLLAAGCSSDSKPRTQDQPPAPDPLVRSTAQGDVRGSEDDSGEMLVFRGIPYAEPPQGDLRFAPPQPAAARSGVLEASDFGPDCAQAGGVMGAASDAEDCLYLNVYSPTDGEDHPVMVWIHGGAFISGSGGVAYIPARLVAEDMVVVTINYRLGALGFLAHPALSDEQDGTSGAYGLLDQKLALEWIQENIANFSGDPDNVTIFGESAGGHSVLALVASPHTGGLFHKAIVESGAVSPQQMPLTMAEEGGAAAFADCQNTGCLRALSVEEVLEAQEYLSNGIGLSVNYGSALQPHESINVALESGNFQHVPILAGNNLDEYSLFIGISALTNPSPPPADQYRAEIGALIGLPEDDPAIEGITQAYPLENFGDSVWQAMSAIGTDVVFACNAFKQAQQLSALVTTYAYEFADREAPVTVLPMRPEGLELGASHAFEIPFLFGTEENFRERGATDEQVELSQQMIRYWTRFARNGDPNGDGDTNWPAFAADSQILQLNKPASAALNGEDFSAYHRCAIWNQ